MTSSIDPWARLRGRCADLILTAPKTWGDPIVRDTMQEPGNLVGMVTYLENNVLGQPWADHLILATAVLYSKNLLFSTILHKICALRNRLGALFPALGLTTMDEWNPDRHMSLYLS